MDKILSNCKGKGSLENVIYDVYWGRIQSIKESLRNQRGKKKKVRGDSGNKKSK